MKGSGSSRPSDPQVPKGPQDALEALFVGSAADPIRRALWLDAVDQRLRPRLPPSLAAHARLANVNAGTLVFLVDSPVWRARLRFAAPELLDVARSIGLDVHEVAVKTTTRSFEAQEPPGRPAMPMSATAREALQAALASLAVPAGKPGKPGDDAS